MLDLSMNVGSLLP